MVLIRSAIPLRYIEVVDQGSQSARSGRSPMTAFKTLRRRAQACLARPVTLPLHYPYQLCLLPLALAACTKPAFPPDPQVLQVARNVEGFDFKTVGQPLMGTGYLTWTSFQFFTHDGETWSLEGERAVLVRRGARPTRYEVEEREIPAASPRRTHLTVRDRSSGRIMAQRDVVYSWTWVDGHWQVGGWQGDEARKWLMSVLVPTSGRMPSYFQRRYEAVAKVEMAPQQMALPSDPRELMVANQNAGCLEGKGAVRRSPPVAVLQGDGWWYEPELPLQRVLCADGRYLALSHVYGNQTVVDLLGQNGTVLFRTPLRLPVPFNSDVVALRGLRLNPGHLEFDVAYAVPENEPHPLKNVPGPTYHVVIDLPADVGSEGASEVSF